MSRLLRLLSLRNIIIGFVAFCLFAFAFWTYERKKYLFRPERKFKNIVSKKYSNLNIANGQFNGMLVYTPPGVDSSSTERLPVIIYFHGKDGNGDGSESELMNILADSFQPQGYALPGAIERGHIKPVVQHQGKQYAYMVISPQYQKYDFPKEFPNNNAVDSVIDYIIAHFQVDPTRVYLTGLSSGANMALEYVASSPKRAGKIAAIAVASVCSPFNSEHNRKYGNTPRNIAAGGTHVWMVHCDLDSDCTGDIPKTWADSIKAAGGPAPRLTLLNDASPDTMLHCERFRHNTWSKMYSEKFRAAGGPNLYEWFIQFQSDTTKNR